MTFTVHRVLVCGPPWDIWAAAEWDARVQTAVGDGYVNEGSHVIRLRFGRVAYLRAYEDSQAVANACAHMAALGVSEAAADPISD
jgi:ketosteroid isomerase-like protein